MDEVEQDTVPKRNPTYRMVIYNKQTGEEVVAYDDIKGGIMVVHQATDTRTGTRQGAFGEIGSIVLTMLKAPMALEGIRKNNPRIAELYEDSKKIIDQAVGRARAS